MMRNVFMLVVVILFAAAMLAQSSGEAEKVWSLEESYWRYVKANQLKEYRSLWHEDFLGWPSVSPEPLRKAQITDWIVGHTSQGETLKRYDLERLPIQVRGDVATTTYRVRLTWSGKNGAETLQSVRIIHTWVRDGSSWRIISGMSAPTNAEGH
jgi:ketosteroid isomerase-like protein